MICCALAAILPAVLAQPVSAEVVSVGGQQVGLQPRSTSLYEGRTIAPEAVEEGTGGRTAEFSNPAGAPVVSSASSPVKVYAIYWSPIEDLYHGNWQQLVNEFLGNMSGASGSLASAFAVDAQYTDAEGAHAATNVAFAGAYADLEPYPEAEAACVNPNPLVFEAPLSTHPDACISGRQVQAELERFIADHSLPRGMGTIYYLLTPPGVTDCLIGEGGSERCSTYREEGGSANAESYEDSFCSYHAAINPGGPLGGGAQTILYAAIPWTAGGLGDYQIAQSARKQASECQDGGWEPAPLPKSPAENRPAEAVQEEPNQSGRGPDGSYDAGLADLVIGQIATEQQNILTDPLLNGWQTHVPAGGKGGGEELTELCRDFFAPALGGVAQKQEGTQAGTLFNEELGGGHYYLNDAFDLAAVKLDYPGVPCLKGVSLVPQFTAPARANAGETIGFDGMESTVTLDAGTAYANGTAATSFPTFEWNFGDGTTVEGLAPTAPYGSHPGSEPCEEAALRACAGSAFHSYAYGGTYDVTLTVTDVGGNTASVTKAVTVIGPPPPRRPGGGGSPSAAQSSQPAPAAPGAPLLGSPRSKQPAKPRKPGGQALQSPKLTAIVVTKSTKALTKGLAVRYSVDEQVAGRFEVLMPSALARRLKLRGASARGLPKGSRPQTVIARALLVTTRAARRQQRIGIPKAIARRLARLPRLTLELRIWARDASVHHPRVSILTTVAKLVR
ncbi:MAG: PKD domain-containing protein [Solirubrobacteraceae bacterium]